MYGQHIGKWPRKGCRGGGKGVLNKSSMRCAHFNLARAHEAGLHMRFRHTHEWIIRQAKAKASVEAEAEAEWICYSTPACLCVYGYCMGIYCIASVCVSGESRKRAVVTRKPQQLKKQPIQVESVGLPSCDCGLLLLLLPWLLLLLPSSEQQESASK